jgi:hypothetical protein
MASCFCFLHSHMKASRPSTLLHKTKIPSAEAEGTFCALSDPAGIRTQDPYIKSVMLYRLSYGIISDLSSLFAGIVPALTGTFRVRAEMRYNPQFGLQI